jgi:hypothetical protein
MAIINYNEILMTLWQQIKDWYYFRKTGYTRAEREYRAWYESAINWRATRVRDIFHNFEHIIIVDPNKFFTYDPFVWALKKDAKQYFWPQRALGENAVWRWERVIRAPSTGNEWSVNELGGEDTVFVATNSDEDAVMIALKYGQ